MGRPSAGRANTMIVIAGTIRLKPGVHEDALNAIAPPESSINQAPGCLVYRFYSDRHDNDLVFLFEKWESAEALAAHFQTSQMADSRERSAQFVAGPISPERYEVSAATLL